MGNDEGSRPDSSGLFWNIPMAHFKMYVKSMVA